MKHGLLLAVAVTLIAGSPVLAQPDAATIIADNDRNGDMGLSMEEWSPQAPIAYPEDADTNKDGKIDLAELQALIARGPPQ